MDFLVRIEVSLPHDLPTADRTELMARERERGRELRAVGTLARIWRLPGRLANVSVWTAQDADALHEALTSLPLWPYAEVTVTALARHPLEADLEAG
jgi:muconolactone D-isomerase